LNAASKINHQDRWTVSVHRGTETVQQAQRRALVVGGGGQEGQTGLRWIIALRGELA
jgi:hypothetical protein